MKPAFNKAKASTKEIILRTLKSSNQAKVEELAAAANVSPVTVRHHLKALQADNLIEVASVKRKVGRPYYVYSLSEQGLEQFPQKYVRLTDRMMDELKERLPAEAVTELFSGMVRSIVEEHRNNYESLTFEERLSYVVDLLSKEGFLAEWEKVDSAYLLKEISCPYHSLVSRHSEFCILDKELIVNVMQTPVTRQSCIVDGDSCCEYTFAADTAN